MADEKKINNNKEVLEEQDVSSVQGGFVGNDKYSQDDYRSVGMQHVHHTWQKDEYYNAQGKRISQKEAEALMSDALSKLEDGWEYVPGYLKPKKNVQK